MACFTLEVSLETVNHEFNLQHGTSISCRLSMAGHHSVVLLILHLPVLTSHVDKEHLGGTRNKQEISST